MNDPVSVTKIIDMPYLSVEMIPSNTVIHEQGDYLTLTNTGNTKFSFLVLNERSVAGGEFRFVCGIVPLSKGFANVVSFCMVPQESVKVPLEIQYSTSHCHMEKGDTGTDTIQIVDNFFEKIIINEISLNYIYQ